MIRVKELVVNGSCVSLYNLTKEGGRSSLFLRKLMPSTFIELWYKVQDNDFSADLWHELRDTEKDFFAQCVSATHTKNSKFNLALAKDTSSMLKRLQLLEGELHAGNINKDLVVEFKDILDKLAATKQMPTTQCERLKKRIQRTYEQAHRNAT